MTARNGRCVYETAPADAVALAEFPGYYVTPRGEIFSKLGAWKRRRLGRNRTGYPICGMVDRAGRLRWPLVHRLVALLFVPGAAAGLTVNHRNLDKTDNRAENLEWMDRSQNCLHWRALMPAAAEAQAASVKASLSVPVIATASDGQSTKYDSLADAARAVNGFSANICTALKRGRPAYGMRWRYA